MNQNINVMDTESQPSQSNQKSEGPATEDGTQVINVKIPEAPHLPPVTSSAPVTGGLPAAPQGQEQEAQLPGELSQWQANPHFKALLEQDLLCDLANSLTQDYDHEQVLTMYRQGLPLKAIQIRAQPLSYN